jgi:AcrR family transcriptional regulator
VKPSPRPYHHGNLRQALLHAAEAALEARGVEHLSLRELSRELGVSHASPQRYLRRNKTSSMLSRSWVLND